MAAECLRMAVLQGMMEKCSFLLKEVLSVIRLSGGTHQQCSNAMPSRCSRALQCCGFLNSRQTCQTHAKLECG